MLNGFKTLLVRRTPQLSALAKELAGKRHELGQLKTDLVERELAFASLRLGLATFEGMYLRTIGTLYADLDEINAQAAERVAESLNRAHATYQATKAREQAARSRSRACGEAANAPEIHPTPELKQLFREVTSRFHPALTGEDAVREVGERLMAEANRAFESGNEGALAQILKRDGGSLEPLPGSEATDQLACLTRQIAQVHDRLAQIETEISQSTEGNVAQLWIKSEKARAEGRDLLSEMAANLMPQLRRARNSR